MTINLGGVATRTFWGPTTNYLEETVGLGCAAAFAAPKPVLLSSLCDLAEPKVTA